MPIGEVTKTLPDRGFGFLRPFDGGQGSIFFHVRDCVAREMPEPGERVRYLETEGRDGRAAAINVEPVSRPTAAPRDDV